MAREMNEGKLLLITIAVGLVFVLGCGGVLTWKLIQYHDVSTNRQELQQQKHELEQKVAQREDLQRQIDTKNEKSSEDLAKLPEVPMSEEALKGIEKLAREYPSINFTGVNLTKISKLPRKGRIPIQWTFKGTSKYTDLLQWVHSLEQKSNRFVRIDSYEGSTKELGLRPRDMADIKFNLKVTAFWWKRG